MPSRTSETIENGRTTHKLLPKPGASENDVSEEAHLKQLCLAMINAINARDFSPTSPAWTPTTTPFIAQPHFSFYDHICGLHEFLRLFDEQTANHPKYFCRANEVNVHINSKNEHATCFVELETNGLPPGIVRQSVGVLEWVLVEGGEWKCRKYRCMPGMDVLGVEERLERLGEGACGS